MAAVTVEVGVEVRGDGQPQFSRGADGRPAERSFGDDMHQVRSLVLPQPGQARFGRQAELEAVVFRDWHAGREHFLESALLGRHVQRMLAWSHQLDGVAAPQ